MPKLTIITWAIVIVVIIAIIAAGWLYFGRTNSVTHQLNGKTNTKSSEKSITAFTFSGLDSQVNEVINNTDFTVTVIVPTGTDITNLTPIISLPDSATVSPNSGVSQDFTNFINYKVMAQDGSAQNYTVKVKAATAQGKGGS